MTADSSGKIPKLGHLKPHRAEDPNAILCKLGGVSLANLEVSWERKCAGTTGTVLVPWAGHFQCQIINIFFK